MRAQKSKDCGVTIIEVLASALLFFLGLGGIFSINTQSLRILRMTRQFATASQILQERVEMFRQRPWPQLTQAESLAQLYQTAAPSARDLADASPTERVLVTVPATPGRAPEKRELLEIQRQAGRVTVIQAADLSREPLLQIETRITWRGLNGSHERRLKAIVGSRGLTRAGLFGSAFGRPAASP